MLNWYDRLRQLVTRIAGLPQPPPGRRQPRFRPKLETLEERQVLSTFLNVDAAPVIQGQTYTPDQVMTTFAPPPDRDVLLVQLNPPAEATGTLYFSTEGEARVQVPVTVTRDANDPSMLDIRVDHNFTFNTEANKTVDATLKLPGLSNRPLKFLLPVIHRHRKPPKPQPHAGKCHFVAGRFATARLGQIADPIPGGTLVLPFGSATFVPHAGTQDYSFFVFHSSRAGVLDVFPIAGTKFPTAGLYSGFIEFREAPPGATGPAAAGSPQSVPLSFHVCRPGE